MRAPDGFYAINMVYGYNQERMDASENYSRSRDYTSFSVHRHKMQKEMPCFYSPHIFLKQKVTIFVLTLFHTYLLHKFQNRPK